jgi:hypothetical protein
VSDVRCSKKASKHNARVEKRGVGDDDEDLACVPGQPHVILKKIDFKGALSPEGHQ